MYIVKYLAMLCESSEFVGLFVFAQDFCIFVYLVVIVNAHIAVLSHELVEVVLIETCNSSHAVAVAQFVYELVDLRGRVHFRENRDADTEEVIYKQLCVDVEVAMQFSHVAREERETRNEVRRSAHLE